MKIFGNITETVGNTPMVRINRMGKGKKADILAKLESFNPLSSIKDRIGVSMIEDAEKSGRLKKGAVIIEPTSGNTGVGLAFVCAAKGYKLVITMPDTMSIERRKLLKIFGADVILTDGKKGMKGAVEEAEALLKKIPGSIMLQQFKNAANPEMHRKTTAEEIWNDTRGGVDIFIAGVGTGGTVTGVGEILKSRKPGVRIVAVEPKGSPVLSGGKSGPHKIQGIGAGFVPDVLNRGIIDEIIAVSDDDAGETARRLAKEEGILTGISGGAAMWAALRLSEKDENRNKKIVVILPDTGERYLSTWLFEE